MLCTFIQTWIWPSSHVPRSRTLCCQGPGSKRTATGIIMMVLNIGLNPGPRARTVKPGPRHLRTRPDPGQNRLGPHKGIPSGEARQCTPAGTEAVISALAPTAPLPIKAKTNIRGYLLILTWHSIKLKNVQKHRTARALLCVLYGCTGSLGLTKP